MVVQNAWIYAYLYPQILRDELLLVQDLMDSIY